MYPKQQKYLKSMKEWANYALCEWRGSLACGLAHMNNLCFGAQDLWMLLYWLCSSRTFCKASNDIFIILKIVHNKLNMKNIWDLKLRGQNVFFSFEQTHPLIHILSLFTCFWSSKKYCKSSFGSPMVMKIFPKRQKTSKIW
jgi:hypothetical protein